MIYVGIDVAKNKHDCFIMDQLGEVHLEAFTFSNTRKGFDDFLAEVAKVQKETNDDNVQIALEATGHYSRNILYFLLDRQFDIQIFNPLSVNLFRKATSLRKTKTDKIDARVIATMLANPTSDGVKNFASKEQAELKELTRYRSRLSNSFSREKVQLVRLLDIIFPELASCVYSVHQKSIYKLLKNYPTTDKIVKARLATLTSLLSESSAGRHGKDKAIELQEKARNSIGPSSKALSSEIISVISTIEHFEKQIAAVEADINEIMDEMDSPITTIKGIANRLGSIILAEIRDIKFFSSPSKLVAFAGLDPSIYQSGQHNSAGRMVKRGSAYLRWAIIEAAKRVAQYNSTFKAYLEKKLSEGKHYLVAISHVAKKLLRTIYYLLKNNEKFDPAKSV